MTITRILYSEYCVHENTIKLVSADGMADKDILFSFQRFIFTKIMILSYYCHIFICNFKLTVSISTNFIHPFENVY